MITHAIATEAEMAVFASQFAKTLKVGDVILLYGEMGAGKTTFVRYLLDSIGYKGVSSPTFSLVHHYETDILIYHLDLYRLASKEALFSIDIDRYLYPKNAISLIEWPERLGDDLPDQGKKVHLLLGDMPESRTIQVENL